MAAATLCALCESIPFHDLLPFPYRSYTFLHSEDETYQEAFRYEEYEPIPEPLGFHHHPDLESLRRASAAGCELCRQIKIQAHYLLREVVTQNARYPELQVIRRKPAFDLWVTGRAQGGKGFWVLSKSAVEPDKRLYVVAVFGYCSEDDEPLGLTFAGRPISGPPDDRTLARVTGWVKECDSHENCLSYESSLPTRLLDVGGPGPEDIVTVVETEDGAMGTYTTLSYCWGGMTNPLATTRSLLESSKKGIRFSDLPLTFRDAIAMTRRLGVRYIWIDSLCICQDDMDDWERESSRMSQVYSNAYVTIAAAGGPDSSHGLFFDRPGRLYLRTALKPSAATDNVEGDILIFPLGKFKECLRNNLINMVGEPLASRGWAFQERVLSRRIVHFATDQISYECFEGTIMEDGTQMVRRYFHAHPGKGAEERLVLGQQSHGGDAMPDLDRYTPMAWWHSLLEKYSDRKLTFASDKFPALSGVAKVYADLLDDEYVAGIWRKDLISGLCWQSVNCTRIEEYRAPSWSWASLDGKVRSVPNVSFDDRRDVASVLDYHVEVDGNNPFGRVKNAWLRIKAPLISLSLSKTIGPRGTMRLKTRHGDPEGQFSRFDTIGEYYSTSADLVKAMELYALVLTVTYMGDSAKDFGGSPDDVLNYTCLILTPPGKGEAQETAPRAMKRVGWISYPPHSLGPGELESSTTIKLV